MGDNTQRQPAIDEVMDWFDFTKVAEFVMSGAWNGYRYGQEDHGDGGSISSVVASLRQHARNQIASAFDYMDRYNRGEPVTTGSGIYRVTVWPSGDVKLMAVIEEWHTEMPEREASRG